MNSASKLVTTKRLGLASDKLPKHVALIPDGNRRWARLKGVSYKQGHDVGLLQRVPEIIEHAFYLGIEEVSVWLFSTENWKRDKEEVDHLMRLYSHFLLSSQLESLIKQYSVMVKHVGRNDRLPQEVVLELTCLAKKTVNNNRHKLNLYLDYGGRDAIVRGINKLIQSKTHSGAVVEAELERCINPHNISKPDLVIRTSGEKRTSGFMIWEAAYSEYYFERAYMPEYTPAKFNLALLDYIKRQRRFGGN